MLRRFVSIRLPNLPTDLAKRRHRRRSEGKPTDSSRARPRNRTRGPVTKHADGIRERREDVAEHVLVVDLRHNVQRVIDCCSNSARLGVRRMMTLAEARALMASNPSGGFHPGSMLQSPATPRRDLADLRRLSIACLRFAPVTVVDGEDGILLDLSGCHRLLKRKGGEAGLLDRMERCFTRHGFTLSTAIADTAVAARAWAGYRDAWRPFDVPQDVRDRPETPGASTAAIGDPAPPDDRIIPPGEHVARLAGLPVEAIGLDLDTLEALRAVNVRLVGELRRLPRTALPARYGPTVLHRIDQATGRIPTMLDPVRPPTTVSVRREFDGPVRSREAIELAIADLLQDLRRGLGRLESGACVIRLKAERPMRSDWIEVVEPRRPTRRRGRLWTMLQPAIERMPLDDGIDALELEVPRHRRLAHESSPMIHSAGSTGSTGSSGSTGPGQGGMRGDRVDVEVTEFIEAVQARFGPATVQRMSASSGHVPEDESRIVCVDETSLETEAETGHSAETAAVLGDEVRPTVIHRPPISIEVRSEEGIPVAVSREGRPYSVRFARGPERIGAPWWRSSENGSIREGELLREHRRDYWRVELESGTWIWIFRASSDRRWFLHGTWA